MFLTACGGNGNNKPAASPSPSPSADASATPEESKAPDPVKLRVFSTFGGTDAAREAFQKALDAFTTANPHVTIENDTMSANDDSFRTKVNTDMTSGNEPDLLFYFVGADANEIISAGKVAPLDEILAADPEWKNGFMPAALGFTKHADGKTYALPLTGFYEGLFVNKKIFADAGVELPTDWEKLKTAVAAFKAKDIIPLAGPFDQSHYLIEHFVLSAAGPEGQAKGLANGIDPNWEKGFAAVKELADLGAFPKDAGTIDLAMASNYYAQGKAAMILEGSWAVGGFVNADTKDATVQDNTTVLPFPAIPGGAGTGKNLVGGFGTGFYLAQSTVDDAAKKDAAIALLKHLTTKDSVKTIASANGGIPAVTGVEVDGLKQAQKDGLAMMEAADSVTSPVDSKVTPETFSELRANFKDVASGKVSPAEALKRAEKIELEYAK
nr:extracellular solute-binding protein [Paenibacillus sp. GSMTC-2017]